MKTEISVPFISPFFTDFRPRKNDKYPRDNNSEFGQRKRNDWLLSERVIL